MTNSNRYIVSWVGKNSLIILGVFGYRCRALDCVDEDYTKHNGHGFKKKVVIELFDGHGIMNYINCYVISKISS
jgi:hypothetical protein